MLMETKLMKYQINGNETQRSKNSHIKTKTCKFKKKQKQIRVKKETFPNTKLFYTILQLCDTGVMSEHSWGYFVAWILKKNTNFT